MAPFRVQVNDPLVKYQTVFLVLDGQPHFLQRLITVKVIWIPDHNGVSGFLFLQGRQDVVLHACIIQFFSSTNIQREATYFATVFAPDGAVPVILGTAGDKLFDGIAVKFIGHFP